MVQLRPRLSRIPAPAEAMVDEDQAASEEEEAEHGSSLAQPSSGAAAEPSDEEEDADDEAPEESTFASAQAEAREEESRVRASARRDKTSLKEKRKRREESFIEQKKRKSLPDAVLEQLTTASEADIKKSPENVKVNLKKKSEQHAKGRNSKKVKVQKVQSVGQIESYMAVRLKDEDSRDSRQEAAKHFIHSCLYGSDSKRTTVNKFSSSNNKRSPVKKAAAQFSTSTWGAQKQQNAKRFKKRWMAKKMKKKTYK